LYIVASISIKTSSKKISSSSSTTTSSSSSIRTLLIVESPAKASTITKILGNNYQVESSLGHIRAITNVNKKSTSSNTIIHGIDTANDFKPCYEIIEGKEKRVSELKQAVKKVDRVFLASDKDREGESISWHLADVLNLDINQCNRITFNEITQQALENAVNNPRTIDMSLVQSQECRAIIDRLLGFELSQLLMKHTNTGNASAGRVMSVALKLIIEKEDDIATFLTSQYFTVNGIFNGNTKAMYNTRFQSKDDIYTLLNDLNSDSNSYTITSSEKTISEKKPLLPFVLSSALKEICRRFSVSSESAGRCLQNLYENGHISYHRTDSPYLSTDFREQVKAFVDSKYGPEYYKDRVYESKTKNSQEAHEGIRPTNVQLTKIDSKVHYHTNSNTNQN